MSELIFPEIVAAWEQDDFPSQLKRALRQRQRQLPLARAMCRGSQVTDTPLDVVVLRRGRQDGRYWLRLGIFFNSIVAGSCCADDPSVPCEENEYGEWELCLDADGRAELTLLPSQ